MNQQILLQKCNELHSAVWGSNITKIEKLVQSGVYVDSTDVSYITFMSVSLCIIFSSNKLTVHYLKTRHL